jgi:hypothetical protein
MPPKKEVTAKTESKKETCGIIMPISSYDGCSEDHWKEVKNILFDAITNAGFEPRLVSDSDEVGVIHKTIVQNIYDDPIVVCDVSTVNPNVMFELGMRLAFDKPTIIVKDDKTSYSFDTSLIEHIGYPRDLRFPMVVAFKEKLAQKLEATYKKSNSSDYTTFLKHFRKITVAELDEQTVSSNDMIMSELQDLRQSINSISKNNWIRIPEPIEQKIDNELNDSLNKNIEMLIHEYCKKNRIEGENKILDHGDVIRSYILSKIRLDRHFRNKEEMYGYIDKKIGVYAFINNI